METTAQQKKRLRAQLRQKRRALDPEMLLRDSAAICSRLLELPELRRAWTVFCYVSCGGEVETHRLIGHLLKQGKTVLVPRCGARGLMDCVPITSLADLRPGAYGILEPPSGAPAVPAASVDFAIVPAVACGRDGSRLGQGGGYYDRFLQQTGCAFAALCTEAFLLPCVPCEAHDRNMKIIVTQQRVLRFEEL